MEDFIDFLSRPESSEERAFMRAVVQGLVDIEGGRAVSLVEAKKRLGLA